METFTITIIHAGAAISTIYITDTNSGQRWEFYGSMEEIGQFISRVITLRQ